MFEEQLGYLTLREPWVVTCILGAFQTTTPGSESVPKWPILHRDGDGTPGSFFRSLEKTFNEKKTRRFLINRSQCKREYFYAVHCTFRRWQDVGCVRVARVSSDGEWGERKPLRICRWEPWAMQHLVHSFSARQGIMVGGYSNTGRMHTIRYELVQVNLCTSMIFHLSHAEMVTWWYWDARVLRALSIRSYQVIAT